MEPQLAQALVIGSVTPPEMDDHHQESRNAHSKIKKLTLIATSCLWILTLCLSVDGSPSNDQNSTTTTSEPPGEAILKDLYNQILERHKESVRQGKEQNYLNPSSPHQSRSDYLGDGSDPRPPQENQAAGDASQLRPRHYARNSIDEAPEMTTVHLTASTPLPYLQVIAMSSNRPATVETTEEGDVVYSESTDSTGGQHLSSMISMQDADEADRHIQYDVVQPSRAVLYSDDSNANNAATSHSLFNYEAGRQSVSQTHGPNVGSGEVTLVNDSSQASNYSLNQTDNLSATKLGEKSDVGVDEGDNSLESADNSRANSSTGGESMSSTTTTTTTAAVPLASTLVEDSQTATSGYETNATARTQPPSQRSGDIQARSMGSLLPHSKAPYAASYQNHLQNRASVVDVGEQQLPRQLDSSQNADQPASYLNQLERTQTMQPPSSRSAGLQLAQPTSSTTALNLASASTNSKQPDPPSDSLQNQLHKLANSINRFVELDPIPPLASSSGANKLSGASNSIDEQPERYFDPMDFDGVGSSHLASQQHSTQRFGSNWPQDSAAASRVSYPTKVAHDFKGGESPLVEQQQQIDSSQLPSVSLNRKTFESVGIQALNFDQMYAIGSPSAPDSSTKYNADANQRQPTATNGAAATSGSNLNQRNGHNFAASLVNVTAPLTPPISASEAMESALGLQAAKNLLHQASGFLGHSNPSMGSHFVNGSSTMSNRTASYSTRQPASSASASQSAAKVSQQPTTQQPRIHSSQPANYFASNSIQKLTPAVSANAVYNPPLNELNHESTQPSSDATRTRYDAPPRSPSASFAPANSADHNQQHPNHAQASGFRSPVYLSNQSPSVRPNLYLNGAHIGGQPTGAHRHQQRQQSATTATPQQLAPATEPAQATTTTAPLLNQNSTGGAPTTNGFITGSATASVAQGSLPAPAGQQVGDQSTSAQSSGGSLNKKTSNLTRVEHISAECSNDLIRTVIIFNGTFRGIIYSSGYVRDPSCLYINGTGKTRYDFSIRLNQCGTLGRQELHPPAGPNEVRRRDQVMWNTLSIQYNPMIEQEWDEHFRVSCEYGSDFWKTVSFSPFNVETNTGSPVVFTVDPPRCQMEILRGHGMVGPRQEAVSGPVTVGDPLTLLIHMKSEKAGYDILVKNCVAHNGGSQRMQLIDSNGCVVNERFISPFRGTYNDNDLKHVTLFSYLKAFRFTGKPVLYLECEVHMCQTSCPPQMCYWRRLSKRSANETDADLGEQDFTVDDLATTTTTLPPMTASTMTRQARRSTFRDEGDHRSGNKSNRFTDDRKSANKDGQPSEPLSDSLSLFQALEVLEDRDAGSPYSSLYKNQRSFNGDPTEDDLPAIRDSVMCYQRAEVFAFLFATGSALLAAFSITIGCCWRAASLTSATRRLNERKRLHYMGAIY